MEQNTQTNVSSSNENADNIKYGRTQLQVKDFTYVWSIENFSMFENCSFYKRKEFINIKSPTFTANDGENELKLQMIIYPYKSAICLEVQRIAIPIKECKYVWIQVFLYSRGVEIKQPKQLVSINNQDYVIYDLVSEFKFNAELKIKCLIQFLKGVTHNELGENPEAAAVMSRSSILNDYEALFKSMKFSDVKIIVRGREFRAHKSVLAARSRVFSAMFEHDMKESKNNVIEICDVKPEIVAEVLRFVYTGKVLGIEKLAVDLMDAAEMYQLEALKFMCETALIAKISVENVAEYLKLVDKYCETLALRKSVMKFLELRKTDIVKMEDFDAILKTLSSTLVHEIRNVMKY